MERMRRGGILVALLLLVAGCAPAATSGPTTSQRTGSPGAAPIQRTLGRLARGEPTSLAAKPLQVYSGSLLGPIRLFNATLDFVDENEGIRAYQAEALPKLNTDSWQVFPDGTMQTTYHLRPN